MAARNPQLKESWKTCGRRSTRTKTPISTVKYGGGSIILSEGFSLPEVGLNSMQGKRLEENLLEAVGIHFQQQQRL